MNDFLRKYWDVESVPKHDLRPVKDEIIDIKTANILTMLIVLLVLIGSVICVCAGAL